MTYDTVHSQVVLFGGYGSNGPLDDTWLWNGANWTQASPATTPPPRAEEAMVYDAAHGQVVMFGGFANANTRLGDTWLWDGTNWTQAHPANSPSARDGAVMVYDAAHGRVVLFGGTTGGDQGDTWLWDGTNWTQASPASSPSARAAYSMVYDNATGRVVLFGGNSAGYVNDTWIWDGTNWTAQTFQLSPPARYSQGMTYDAALGQAVMALGYNGNYLGDTWLYNGASWTQNATTPSPSGRYLPNGLTYDAAHSQVVLFGGYNASSGELNDTWTFGLPGAYGNVNVCSVGQQVPAPCSKQLAFTYTFPTVTTIAQVRSVTQGTSGLDFGNPIDTNTCVGTHAAGDTCIANVTFTPSAPGLRQGAIQFLDNSGNILAATLLSGVGQAPATAFGPSAQTVLNTTGSFVLSQPKGVTVDAVGNVFVSDTGNRRVVKVATNGFATTVNFGLSYPQGIAVNGSGDLFIADNDLSRVVKVPYGCTNSSCEVAIGTGLTAVLGAAVDGAGNVYAAEFNTGEVIKIPAGCTSAACQTVAYSGSNLVGVTLDAAGDLFVADFGRQQIVEVPVGCASASCYIQVGQGWSQPEAVAVDAAGDVFVSDLSAGIVEVPAGCVSTSCQVTMMTGVSAFGLAVDAKGNLFIPDGNTNQVFEVTRSQTPSLDFAPTNVASTSSDSPKTFAIQNIGNQPLGAIGLALSGGGGDFTTSLGVGPLQDCFESNLLVLAPGRSCQITLSFMPHGGGISSGTFNFSDNALNSTSATQSVAFSGVGQVPTFALNVSMLGAGTGTVIDNLQQVSCSEANHGSSVGTCTGNYPVGSQITFTAAANGTSAFLGWGGVCASAGTGLTCNVTVSQAASVTANFVDQNAGSYNVCPVGQPIAGPCSNAIPVTLTLAATTTIGATRVVTQGATGLDFTQGTGNTCVGTIVAGNSCTVNVNFAPMAPGLRMGAAQIFDNAGNLVGSLPVYGLGQEPAIAFGPGMQSTVDTGAFTFSQPKGILTDAAGNVFVSDGDPSVPKVVKIAPNGTKTSIGVGLQFPQEMAEDGAGNLYIADNNLNAIVEVPSGCMSSACQQVIGSNSRSQLGVAVDGAGNVFFDDFLDGEVIKNPAGCNSAACQTVVYNPNGSNPVAITLDSAGNLFVADFGLKKVMEVPAGCTTTACLISVGTGWNQPDGVAVDAAGNVYVADAGLNALVEVPAGCTSSACQLVLVSGIDMVATAIDATGNLFVDDLVNRRVIKLNRSQPPSFAFATTNFGSTSTDSPQSFTVQSIGNQPLSGSLDLNLGGNFTPNPASTCGAAFTLAPGSTCNESFSFTPQTATFFTGTATVSDNTLNNARPLATQIATLTGTGAINGQAGLVAVPNVVGQPQSAASAPITASGLATGTVASASSQSVPSGSIISQNPDPGTQVSVGSVVNLLVSSGQPVVPSANPLTLENNYFLTGDYVSAGVTLRGTGINGLATGNITIPAYTQSTTLGVPDGADIVDAFLYWETLESTAVPSSANGTFNNYPIVGQQIGSDIPSYTDGNFNGTLRAYRASVNIYLLAAANGIRYATGTYKVSLPDGGNTALPLTEGASLVLVYRVLSPNFPLKSVIIYDGAAAHTNIPSQLVQGFYDAVGGASGTGKSTNLFATPGAWHNSINNAVSLGQSNQYSAPLDPANAYAAVIFSTPVNNSDNDGVLDAWKAGPVAPDFHAGQPGYYDVKTSSWVGLPSAKHGQKDLFVQLDYMCAVVNADGSCDSTKENLFPSPDPDGNDPLAMVQQAFLNSGVHLHLQVGNAIPESTCTDDLTTTPATLCQFPGQPGVVGWKNSLEFSKLFPRNLYSCIAGGDCTTRFPYGQKDSYHYVLMGHSLAIPAWNSRYGTLTSIVTAGGVTTISTVDRGTGINACPSRITLSGVLGNPTLNGVYNTTGCADTKTITVATPGVPNYTYPNTILAEPVIGLTSGTVTSISGYSDLGGADSAVTLGLWLTAAGQDMSKRANVLAGTIFHEIGHTLGLSHGGLYYDTPGSYVPTFEANCKPNYQSVMNYLFQLDLVGPNQTIAFSNQTLNTLNESNAGSTKTLTDVAGNAATFPTSAWYVPYTAGSNVSAATRHCDGTPLAGDSGYRVDASIAPITPAWTNGQDINFIGTLQTQERGFNDLTNMDLRQIGATGGEFASLASILSFGSSSAPLNINAGGNVTLGSGGTVALGSGGNVTLGSGGNVTLGSGGTITLGSGGNVTLGSGGNVTLGSGGVVTPGSSGLVTLGSGGNVTLGSGGTITLGSGGNITLGSGGNVTLGSGGTITLGSGGAPITIGAGGSYAIDGNGGTITLGSGGNVTLGSGGNVTLGSGGLIALGSGGNVTLGSGGNVTLGSGGTITLGSGGNVTLGSGGNVTLGSGGLIALGSGGTITLGSGGNVTLGSGGTVTLGSGGDLSQGSGGNVTLGSGGSATLGAGGTITLGSGGNVTLGSGGNVTLGSGGTITLGSGGNITLGSGGNVTLGSGGTITLGSGGAPITIGAGGNYTFGASGGTITLGSGGNITLGSGGNVTLGSGGLIALGSGGTITLGSGGNVTLGSGGVVTLGSGGNVTLGSGSAVDLGTVSRSTSGSGGPLTNELTYETANSVVRPPTAPTETSTPTGVRVTWKAPAFGVVSTYTIYRSSNGATPVVIGSVSGVNGNPPATEFTDTNPDLTSQTVIYTIATTLVPDTAGPPRQSVPSVPAVLKNDQTISLDPLPSSVTITASPTVTATAFSAGIPNGLQVLFTAAGSCAIGSQTIASKVSSASVTLTGTGSCTVSASQSGTTAFNAANTVSGTFMVLPQGSSTKSQMISFSTLPNVQYGNSFSLSASSSSNLPVTFAASGPCTTGGTISAVGVCTITASVPGNSTYSAATLTQSFNIYPAVLKVTATNLTTTYGQAPPALTSMYSGFVNGDSASVVNGAPALSTTATSTSNPGGYPITVSTGTLATTNYSFLYVTGTLTVQPANQSPLVLIAASSLTYNQGETLSVTGGSTGGLVTYSLIAGPCTVSGARLTATSGTGACQVTATMAGNARYNPVTSTPSTIVTLRQASQTILFTTNPPATALDGTSFKVAATATSGSPVAFTSSGACSNAGATYTVTSNTGTCSVIANQDGNANYAAAPAVSKTVIAIGPMLSLSASNIDFGTVHQGTVVSRNITITNVGTAPANINDPFISIVKGGNSNEFVALSLCPKPLAPGKSCMVTIAFLAGPFYVPQTATLQIMSNAPGSPQPITLTATVINPKASLSPESLNFETINRSSASTLTVNLSNPGSTPLIFTGAGITIAGATSFTQTNNCGTSLAPGARCAIAVTFKPGAKGTFRGNLTVLDNAQTCGGGTQTVALSGKGN